MLSAPGGRAQATDFVGQRCNPAGWRQAFIVRELTAPHSLIQSSAGVLLMVAFGELVVDKLLLLPAAGTGYDK